jgi:hypothetical protein
MQKINQIITALLCSSLILSGCMTTTTGKSTGVDFGPQISSMVNKAMRMGKEKASENDSNRPKLDIVVPIFDPGLPEADKEYETKGVWPELRRAEAIRFAQKMKLALEDTGVFGAVRVTPDKTATGDLYVMGKIEESNGEDVQIEIQVYDISGNRWLYDTFDHEITETFHKNVRNDGKDPYDPMFEKAAKSIVEELSFHQTADLENTKQITDLRFGANFIEEAFAEHLELKDGAYKLASFPSDDDPMLIRTKSIRVRDQLFVDGLQDSYRFFSEQMNDSYYIWQEQSLMELEAKREAEMEAAGEAAAGVLLIGLAVLAAAAGAKSNNYGTQTAGMTGAVLGGVAGAKFLTDSFQTREESKVHSDALEELGQSMNSDLAPKVVAFEEQNVELTGTAKEQFAQWRSFLKKIYLQEMTPEKQL